MRQPTCPNTKCHSAHTRAINAIIPNVIFGSDPQTLKKGVYIVFQCDGCGEIFMRILEEKEQ
jgi:hypothetical protein